MNLVSIRIITANVENLVKFYEYLTKGSAVVYTPDFAELKTDNATLAIGSVKTLRFFGAQEAAKASMNQSAIIEFIVSDVESLYETHKDFLHPYLIQKPTTMPWGNKSLLFRDPDGNLVNFFTPVSYEAVARFNSK